MDVCADGSIVSAATRDGRLADTASVATRSVRGAHLINAGGLPASTPSPHGRGVTFLRPGGNELAADITVGVYQLGGLRTTGFFTGSKGHHGHDPAAFGCVDAGTALRTSNTAKDEAVGPMGCNSGTSLSEAKMAVPAASCDVTTTRGLEVGDGMPGLAEDILETGREELARVVEALGEVEDECFPRVLGLGPFVPGFDWFAR